MHFKHLPLAAAVAALTFATSSQAITVNVTDFSFAPVGVHIGGAPTGTPDNPSAGQFYGTLSDDAALKTADFGIDATATSLSGSFVGYCAELNQEINPNTPTSGYGVAMLNPYKTTELSKLFTATVGFVVNGATSAAMQAAIWEIIYETSPPTAPFSLTGGAFTISPIDSGASAAFVAMNTILGNLDQYSASATITLLHSETNQDIIIGNVPEPETWALMLGGLGVMGFLARRRNKR